MKFDDQDLRGLLIPYVAGGHRQDEFVVESLRYENRALHAVWKARRFFPRSTDNGAFHVTGINTPLFVAQLGSTLTLREMERDLANTTLVQTHLSVDYLRAITSETFTGRAWDLQLEKKTLSQFPGIDTWLASCQVEIADGRHRGQAKMLVIDCPAKTAKM